MARAYISSHGVKADTEAKVGFEANRWQTSDALCNNTHAAKYTFHIDQHPDLKIDWMLANLSNALEFRK